jgi:hypothetical protein
LDEDSPSPPATGAKVARGVVCTPVPPSVEASVVVCQPTKAQVLELVIMVLSPPSVEDVCHESSEEDDLSMLEIRLHIAINVISHLNVAEDFRLLLGEEHSLREFLLDQILLLRVEDLLGTQLVAPPG